MRCVFTRDKMHHFGDRYSCFVSMDTIDGICLDLFLLLGKLVSNSWATMWLTLVSNAMISSS